MSDILIALGAEDEMDKEVDKEDDSEKKDKEKPDRKCEALIIIASLITSSIR